MSEQAIRDAKLLTYNKGSKEQDEESERKLLNQQAERKPKDNRMSSRTVSTLARK